jgi:hypothetical protein
MVLQAVIAAVKRAKTRETAWGGQDTGFGA